MNKTEYVESPYIQTLPVDDGLLMYNLLSLELIYLKREELDEYKIKSSDLYKRLIEKWFYIPVDFSPQSMMYLLKQKRLSEYYSSIDNKIIYATILTTTGCNAKCSYCYEYNCEKNTMSLDICKQTVTYLKNNCNDIMIRWFGGEPLLNADVINYISTELKNSRVSYESNMITNGYLLDKFDDDTLLNLWKLRKIQITIDGTQHEYLKIKKLPIDSYIKVVNQIIRCAKLGIKVNVRIHVTLANTDDITLLLQELEEKFKTAGTFRKNIYIYLIPLFVGLGNVDTALTYEQDIELAEKFIELDRQLRLLQKRNRKIVVPNSHHCMADSKNHIVITPTGKLTLCEHCSDREFVGDVWNGVKELPDKWFEPREKQSECDSCFYAPQCNRLEMCESESHCTVGNRMILEYRTKTLMQQYYVRWKNESEKRKNQVLPTALLNLFAIANIEIGCNDYKKYSSEVFGVSNRDPWCIIYLCWLFLITYGRDKALKMLCLNGFTSDVIQLLEAFKSANMFSYRDVQPGYIIFLRMNRHWTCHAELVIEVTDSSIITIGGNCNGKVQKNEYSREDERISGFGKIIYE